MKDCSDNSSVYSDLNTALAQPPIKYKFIKRLLDMLKNTKVCSIVSWNKEGKTIEIKDIKGFVEEILPKYYKHSSLSNFIRQLNMYSFKKIKDPTEKECIKLVYSNSLFQKDRPELICKIDRQKFKHQNEKPQELSDHLDYSQTHSMRSGIRTSDKGQGSSGSTQSERCESLRKKIKSLNAQIKLVTSQNKELIEKSSNNTSIKENALSYIDKLEKSVVILYNSLIKQKEQNHTKTQIQNNQINKRITSFVNRTKNDQEEGTYNGKRFSNCLGRQIHFLSTKREASVSTTNNSNKNNNLIPNPYSKIISSFVDKLLCKIGTDDQLACYLSESNITMLSQSNELNWLFPTECSNKSDATADIIEKVFHESFNNVKNESFSKVHDSYFD